MKNSRKKGKRDCWIDGARAGPAGEEYLGKVNGLNGGQVNT